MQAVILRKRIKGLLAKTLSAIMLAYTYASLFSDRKLRELPGQGRKPEEWECPECYWDSTNDDGMTNAVISVYRGDVYERECTAHWTCPVCGHESDTWEKVIERRRIMKLKYLYAMYDNGEFQGGTPQRNGQKCYMYLYTL